MHNGILLSHKREWNNAICSNMNGLRDYFIELSQGESYLWYHLDIKSKKYYKQTYLPKRNWLTRRRKQMVIKMEVGGGISWEYGIKSCTIPNIFLKCLQRRASSSLSLISQFPSACITNVGISLIGLDLHLRCMVCCVKPFGSQTNG